MKLSLVVINAGKSAGQIIAITLPQFVIGRDPECNLRPASALISKRHCALLVKSAGVFVRDFDSTNGTFVNDQPIKGEAALKDGDLLKVGPLVFRVAIEGKVVAAKPVAAPTPIAIGAPHGDDDVAALLLAMDDAFAGIGDPTKQSGVPEGSTVMDMPALSVGTTQTPTPTSKKPAPKSGDNAQDAARAILAKFGKKSK